MRLLLQYTLLFSICILGVFGVLILMHKSLIQYGDGYKQGFFWTLELKHQLENLFAGRGIELWSWSKGMGMDVQLNFFFDPFNIIAALFPMGYVELGYSFAVVLKLYFGGLAFLLLCREIDIDGFPALFGSLSYVFSSFFITVSLIHSSTLVNIYMLPLLIMGAEKIYRKKSPLQFVLAVAYYLVVDFYYAYMAAIAVIAYIVVRYFKSDTSKKPIDYAKTYSKFVAYGLLGFSIAAFQTIVDLAEILDASVDSATDSTSSLFSSGYFIKLGSRILGKGSTTDYYVVGISALILIFVALSARRISREKTNLILALFFIAALCLPWISGMFNGFGYPTLRWVFILILFATLAASDYLKETDGEIDRVDLITALAAVIIITVWTLGLSLTSAVSLGKVGTVYTIIRVACGIIGLAALTLRSRGRLNPRSMHVFLICLLVVSLSLEWTWVFKNDNKAFLRNNQINQQLNRSPQRVGNKLEDDGFFRIDQVDAIAYSHVMKSPANESLWWKSNNIYLYNSRIPQSQFEYNRLLGNNYGYSKRVYVLSNDNRAGLDYLSAVRFFIGDDKKTMRLGSDEYAAYGFEFEKEIDGVNIFRNKYYASLGYSYERVIPESEFLKFSRLEREQVLLQAAVVEDALLTDADKDRLVSAADMETKVTELDYEITNPDGLEFKKDRIVVSKEDASFTLSLSDVNKAQIFVSIDGLLRNPNESGQSKSFIIHAANEYVDKMADNDITNQSIPYIRDYDFNMGYYDKYDGEIKITLSNKGKYAYDSIKVYAMDMSLHDKYMSELEKHAIKVSDYDTKCVKGEIDAGAGGMLYLSMPIHESWKLYIDGKEAETIDDVNIAFWGAWIDAGVHDIELKYVNTLFRTGLMISALGLCMLCIVVYRYRKSRKAYEGEA